jgi:peptidoglycan biosynthesis protein MviN/MurJ (putative lipid II flippase)
MSERLEGILIGITVTLFLQLILHVIVALREEDHHPPKPNRDDAAMKRHLDELYQDIDRGKLP